MQGAVEQTVWMCRMCEMPQDPDQGIYVTFYLSPSHPDFLEKSYYLMAFFS